MFGQKKETLKPDQKRSLEGGEGKQKEFIRAAAKLEMNIEDTANALSGGVEKSDPLIREKIIDALVDNIKNIPQVQRQKLLESVRNNIDARVKEAHERQMKPEEIHGRQANAELMKEVDARLFIELPESDGGVIELEQDND